MIKRIVKLSFDPDKVESFLLDVFEPSKDQIRAFPGCLHMELLRDVNQPNQLFTFSLWENPEALENYRRSVLFQNTWAKTKALFSEKAQAWTVELLDDGGLPG
jgi:quinol monooxygenase YgiN